MPLLRIILSAGPTLVEQGPNPHSDSFDYSNIYDENIYKTAGLPDDYGNGTSLSNVRADFDTGVTVENEDQERKNW